MIKKIMNKLGYVPKTELEIAQWNLEVKNMVLNSNVEKLEQLTKTHTIFKKIYEIKCHIANELCSVNKRYKAIIDGKASNRKLTTYGKFSRPEDESIIEPFATRIYSGNNPTSARDAIVAWVNEMFKFTYKRDPLGTDTWLSSSQVVDALNLGWKYDDCDGKSFIIYFLLKTWIRKHSPQDEWRLYLCINDFFGHTTERHMNLLWVDEKLNDFVFIESTVWSERNGRHYFKKPARKQANYDIHYVFNDEVMFNKI